MTHNNDTHTTVTDEPVLRWLDDRPCGRCGDIDRFADAGDSVCSTCGLTRFAE